jgi:hypothetical protein
MKVDKKPEDELISRDGLPRYDKREGELDRVIES